MSLLKYVGRLKRMDALISKRGTGTPDDFAKKLGICKSMLMVNLSELKELGAPVRYDSINQTYYYINPCRLVFEFEVKNEDLRTVKGGASLIWVKLGHSNNIRMAF